MDTEYMTAEEYEASLLQAQKDLVMDETFHAMVQSEQSLRVPRSQSFTRKDVVKAFSDAFHLIGGVPRLAVWANAHPTEFFKLYARLLPSQASSALGETNELVVRHVLPRSALDE